MYVADMISYGGYVELLAKKKWFRKEASIEGMEKMLGTQLFFRADWKYLVNLGHVYDYKNGIVTILQLYIPVDF